MRGLLGVHVDTSSKDILNPHLKERERQQQQQQQQKQQQQK
jgi:hypothetical protein